jgi:CheY-like chemotaxis protein
MKLDREMLARQSYGRALAEARRAPSPRAWARLLRAARNLRFARDERERRAARRHPGPTRADGRDRAAPRRPLRLLVVEDDRALREALVELLEGAGFHVRAAIDGREALDALGRPERPEVVILDLDLPVVSGWTVRERMLSDPALARVPVIVLTATRGDAPPDVRRVPKPFEVHDLVRAVEQTAVAR